VAQQAPDSSEHYDSLANNIGDLTSNLLALAEPPDRSVLMAPHEDFRVHETEQLLALQKLISRRLAAISPVSGNSDSVSSEPAAYADIIAVEYAPTNEKDVTLSGPAASAAPMVSFLRGGL